VPSANKDNANETHQFPKETNPRVRCPDLKGGVLHVVTGL